MSAIIQMAASTPVTSFYRAVCMTAGEHAFKGLFCKVVDLRTATAVNLWIDYPQALTAGCLALAILGTGGAGIAVCASLCVLPIVFKATVMFAPADSCLSKLAGRLNDVTRIAAKVINLVGGITLAWTTPLSINTLYLGAGALYIAYNTVKDATFTYMFDGMDRTLSTSGLQAWY